MVVVDVVEVVVVDVMVVVGGTVVEGGGQGQSGHGSQNVFHYLSHCRQPENDGWVGPDIHPGHSSILSQLRESIVQK